MKTVERLEGYLDGVVVERFVAFYNAELDGQKQADYRPVYVAIAQAGPADIPANGAALIVTDAVTRCVLFKGVIEKDWEFYFFPVSLQPTAPPEVQVSSTAEDKDNRGKLELLQWFSFVREEDQFRFRDVFKASLDATRVDGETLSAEVVTAVLERGLNHPSTTRASDVVRGSTQDAPAEEV